MSPYHKLHHQCLAEVVGTFILVFFGVGSVHTAVVTGMQVGIWQIGAVWGVAIGLAIYATAAISGAHINPAITIAFATFRDFPWRRVPAYIGAQFVGAILGAIVLYILFNPMTEAFELKHGIERGSDASVRSAMIYGEYFPNPAVAHELEWKPEVVTHSAAMLAEALGTAFLAFFVFALTDNTNRAAPRSHMAPIFIGLTVTILISIIAPITQGGFNPARDFGPRLWAYFQGWGAVAIPGPRGGFFTVYILAPVVGAMGGALAWRGLIRYAPTNHAPLESPE